MLSIGCSNGLQSCYSSSCLESRNLSENEEETPHSDEASCHVKDDQEKILEVSPAGTVAVESISGYGCKEKGNSEEIKLNERGISAYSPARLGRAVHHL